jgi:hypothetical protein
MATLELYVVVGLYVLITPMFTHNKEVRINH